MGEIYYILAAPTQPGDAKSVPSIQFSYINVVAQNTKEFAYSQGVIFVGILAVLVCCAVLSSNFAVQLELEEIDPPDEIEFKRQMKSYRQVGNVWDPDHEKLMVKMAEEIPLPERRKKKGDEENKKGNEQEGQGEGGQSLEVFKSGNNGQIMPPGFQQFDQQAMLQKMMQDLMAESDEYDSESEQEIEEIKQEDTGPKPKKKHGIFDVNADDFLD